MIRANPVWNIKTGGVTSVKEEPDRILESHLRRRRTLPKPNSREKKSRAMTEGCLSIGQSDRVKTYIALCAISRRRRDGA
jgi:hypothetical protein